MTPQRESFYALKIMNRFFILLAAFWLYTIFKIDQAWAGHEILATVIASVLFFLILSASFLYRSNPEIFHRRWFAALAWAGSLAMGLWATFVILSIPFDLLGTAFFLYDSIFPSGPSEKREMIFHVLYTVILAASVVFTILGYLEVFRGPRIKKVSVSLKDLPASLKGFKIAQISDLHVGPTIRERYVEQMVQQTNEAQVDVIVVTGDLVDAHLASIQKDLLPLENLKARHGVFYVTGNHEYYWEANGLIRRVKQLGFQVLLNENRVVRVGDSKVMIAGITDPMGGHFGEEHLPSIPKAARTSEKVDLKILLAHRPGVSEEAEAHGFDLQFSGHTHAGQFFPFSLFIGFAHKYTRGLYQQGRLWVYVNPGTGYWGPPNRLGVAPEITLMELS